MAQITPLAQRLKHARESSGLCHRICLDQAPNLQDLVFLSPWNLQADSVTQNQMIRVRASDVVRGGLEADYVPEFREMCTNQMKTQIRQIQGLARACWALGS